MLGSMGLAIPIAMGCRACAARSTRESALEGDGSLLMQLGCLSTVAIRAPKNLTIVVMDNAIYQITGSQKTATAAGVDLVAVEHVPAGWRTAIGPPMKRIVIRCLPRPRSASVLADRASHRRSACRRPDERDPEPYPGSVYMRGHRRKRRAAAPRSVGRCT